MNEVAAPSLRAGPCDCPGPLRPAALVAVRRGHRLKAAGCATLSAPGATVLLLGYTADRTIALHLIPPLFSFSLSFLSYFLSSLFSLTFLHPGLTGGVAAVSPACRLSWDCMQAPRTNLGCGDTLPKDDTDVLWHVRAYLWMLASPPPPLNAHAMTTPHCLPCGALLSALLRPHERRTTSHPCSPTRHWYLKALANPCLRQALYIMFHLV